MRNEKRVNKNSFLKRKRNKPKRSFNNHIQSQTYRDYIHSDKWRELRREAFTLVRNRCVNCGMIATELHHLNYYNLQKERIGIDVVPLCHKCHRFCHWRRNWDNDKSRQKMASILREKFLMIVSF